MKTFNYRVYWDLKLGGNYILMWSGNIGKQLRCRLIQPTEKGYNFLNLDTHKCVLKRHLYPRKNENGLNFNISRYLILSKEAVLN